MKVLVILLVVTTSSCVFSARRYSAEEEKRNGQASSAIIPDRFGIPHFVGLQQLTNKDPNVTRDDLNVYFYSRTDPPGTEIYLAANNFDGTIPSDGFDPSKKSIFFVHGWTLNNNRSTRRIREEVLKNGGANMFGIDWSRLSHEFYTVAVMGVNDLGKICAEFIDKMLEKYDMDPEQIMLVGESLGAHVAGACGFAMKRKPGTIVGLDPALPLFFVDEPENRLSVEDAGAVHVLHTNSGFLSFASSIGHADYFANGGITQPGCRSDILQDLTCAHKRASKLFTASINSEGFKSHECDSYENYLSGFCKENKMLYFRGLELDSEARGDFYYNTNAEPPFVLN